MIKKLVAFDMDGTLMDTPMPDVGREQWKSAKGVDYPHKGWWGRPESLDLDVFDIKPFPSLYKQLQKEIASPDSYVIILTSRMNKLRPQVQAILDKNGIHVDRLDMKYNELTKGEKILRYVDRFPDLVEIDVFDDREGDIESYKAIRDRIPADITLNVYLATNGGFSLLEAKLDTIIKEEIENLFDGIYIKK